jgi:hypothetical protein
LETGDGLGPKLDPNMLVVCAVAHIFQQSLALLEVRMARVCS